MVFTIETLCEPLLLTTYIFYRMRQTKRAVLILEDGTTYEGQILVTTYPILGNYGVPPRREKDDVSEYYESTLIHPPS